MNFTDPQEEINFSTQQSGIDLSRPDMIGVNQNQEEVIIIESKFWAGLTDNQPITYLKRLEESNYSNQKILLFICPEKRVNSLWFELKRKCNNKYEFTENINLNNYHLKIRSDLTITITSWNKVINVIRHELIANNLNILLSDINQLDGLCSRMDEEAFLPLKEKDLGVEIPKRICGYYNLIDKIADRLKFKMNVNTDGLRNNIFHIGYRNYMMINDYSVTLELNFKYWIEEAETPIWIGIKDSEWDYIPGLKNKLININRVNINQIFVGDYGFTFIPIFLPLRVSQDIIINEVIDFIEEIFDRLPNSENRSEK